jgi:signal transduction histidine kinase
MRLTPASLRPWRSSIWARIVIACATLFLVPGAILTGVAYTQIGHVLVVPYAPPGEVSWRQGNVTYFDAGNDPHILATRDASKQRGFLEFTLAGLGLGTLLAGGLGWAVSRRVLRPLAAVTTAAQIASQENLDQRLALAGPPDELKELADTFDAMLARLDAAFASQRRFIANASHELRTPLTEMRTLIDVTTARPAAPAAHLEPVLAAIGAAVDKSEELIEALLTLARSDRGPGPAELVDLPTAVEDAIDLIGPAAAARQIQIGTALQDAQVTGDRVLLERLVSNLIENAVRHNVTGGWVLASTRTRSGIAEITVSNGGEHIPPTRYPSCSSRSAASPAGPATSQAPGSACPSPHRWPGRTAATPRPTPGQTADWTCRSHCRPQRTGPGTRRRCPGAPEGQSGHPYRRQQTRTTRPQDERSTYPSPDPLGVMGLIICRSRGR